MASVLLFFLFLDNSILFFIVRKIELFCDDVETIGNDRADTTTIDKNEFPIEGGHQHIIDDGEDLHPFPVTGFEKEEDLLPFKSP